MRCDAELTEYTSRLTGGAPDVGSAGSKQLDASDLRAPSSSSVPSEGALQRDIKKIVDELDIMLSICRRQKDIIDKLRKHVGAILDSERRWGFGDDDNISGQHRDKCVCQCELTNYDEKGDENMESFVGQVLRDRARRKDQWSWFRKQSQDLLSQADDRVHELEGLRRMAENAERSVSIYECSHVKI